MTSGNAAGPGAPGTQGPIHSLRAAIEHALPPRALFVIAALTGVATWLMLLIGGTVNPTGSSLACADWSFRWGLATTAVALPLIGVGVAVALLARARRQLGIAIVGLGAALVAVDFIPVCNGDPFPAMTGGVLYEHGHRLWGWLVGVLTTLTLIGTWASRDIARGTRWMALGAFLLVIAQGGLGGLTVLLGLNPYLSTAHLVAGYGFLALMTILTWRLSPARRAAPTEGARHERAFLVWAAALVLAQILVGGIIRHFGAGMICGTDPIGCAGHGLWPEMTLQKLHMVHRFLGYAVLVVVLWASLRARRDALRVDRGHIARLAWLPVVLVTAQVALGLVTVVSGKIVWVVTLHTAIGGLLLAATTALWVGFGPLGQRRTPAASEGAAHPRGVTA